MFTAIKINTQAHMGAYEYAVHTHTHTHTYTHNIHIHIKVCILYVDGFKEYEIIWLTQNISLNRVYFKH